MPHRRRGRRRHRDRCIALALAHEGEFDGSSAWTVSGDASRWPGENGDAERARGGRGVEGDLRRRWRAERLDLLVANPPYLTAAEYDSPRPSVARLRAALALERGRRTRRHAALGRRGAQRDEARRAGSRSKWTVHARPRWPPSRRRSGGTSRPCYDDLFGRARYVLARRREHVMIDDKAQELGRLIGQAQRIPGAAAGGTGAARRRRGAEAAGSDFSG